MHQLTSAIAQRLLLRPSFALPLVRFMNSTRSAAPETLEEKKARASREAIEQFQRIE